jgi:hypothetical protein
MGIFRLLGSEMVHAIRPGVRIKAVEVLLRNGAQEPFRLLEPTA